VYPTQLTDTFRQQFGYAPTLLVRAPGRINLIGEHTDYNHGWVLPAAIDKAMYFAVAPRPDGRFRMVAHDLNDTYKTDIQSLTKSKSGWPNYLLGVVHELIQLDLPVGGADVVFGGDIPLGSGLSSSAALESGWLVALDTLYRLSLDRPHMARLAMQAENHFVGTNCGIMDMYASLMGRAGHALLLDCRSLATRYIPLDLPDHAFVLCNSGVKHALVDSEYNARRADCEAAVRVLADLSEQPIQSLRDVSSDLLSLLHGRVSATVRRRCSYVLDENERVLQACKALEINDLSTVGHLLFASHEGLRHQYEVSCTELDFLVEHAAQHSAVAGARMMGGGFGGCTLNLVRRGDLADFLEKITTAYHQQFGRHLICHVVQPSEGVSVSFF
jgi:galactokinase